MRFRAPKPFRGERGKSREQENILGTSDRELLMMSMVTRKRRGQGVPLGGGEREIGEGRASTSLVQGRALRRPCFAAADPLPGGGSGRFLPSMGRGPGGILHPPWGTSQNGLPLVLCFSSHPAPMATELTTRKH